MEKYIVKVNGKEYEVEIEKVGETATSKEAAPAPEKAEAPKAQPAPVSGTVLQAGAAGKVFKLLKKQGEHVEKGEDAVILEAMKMEIPMIAPVSGTVGEIFVNEGQPVEAGDKLLVIA